MKAAAVYRREVFGSLTMLLLNEERGPEYISIQRMNLGRSSVRGSIGASKEWPSLTRTRRDALGGEAWSRPSYIGTPWGLPFNLSGSSLYISSEISGTRAELTSA